MQPPEQHNASFHLQSLSKVGLVQEGLKFLRSHEEENNSHYLSAAETNSASLDSGVPRVACVDDDDLGSVTDAAWQSLFKGCIHHGNLQVAEQVWDLALEKQQLRKRRLKDSFPSPPSVETTTWLSQLLRAFGKSDQWREAVRVAEK